MTQPAKLASNEQQRLARLKRLFVLDSNAETVFDDITKLASELCGVPIALISLIDENRQWFKSNFGLNGIHQTERDIAFCAHTILQNNIMEVHDASQDDRFKNNPLVTSDPRIRFYAGAPITMPDGENIGSLCLIDQESHYLSEAQKSILNGLAKHVAKMLLARESTINLLHDESMRFTNIVESSDDAIISKSTDGIVLTWNPGAERIFGYKSDEIIGRPITILFRKIDIMKSLNFSLN